MVTRRGSGSRRSASAVRTLTRLIPPSGPNRWLAVGTFTRSAGLGAVIPFMAVYFVRSVGLSAEEVGLGASVASVLGIAASVPAGRLTDRYGAREMTITVSAAAALAMASFALVRSFAAFLATQCLVTVFFSAVRVAESTLVGRLLEEDGRVEFRAYQRTVYNLGFSFGVFGAVLPLQMATKSAYIGLIIGGSVTTATMAVAASRVPSVSGAAERRSLAGIGAVADWPYVLVSVLTGLIAVRHNLLMIAVPLWVIGHTTAPPSTASALLVLNTMLVVLLQVRFSRGASSPLASARVNMRGGLALLLSCVLFAGTASLASWSTVVVLMAAMVCFTFGEMWTAAAGWSFGYDLADPRALGDYQGIFGLGGSIADIIGPVLATGLVVSLGAVGWWAIGGYFMAATALTGPAVRSSLARRTHRMPRSAPEEG